MKLIAFDCDSTLSAIEGIDELGRLRGPSVFEEIEYLTNAAMNGDVAIDDIFSRRLEIIKPDRDLCAQVGQMYIEEIEPDAIQVINQLRQDGWLPVIISGGFSQVIQPLANHLGIDRVEAVPLKFNPDGSYAGYDTSAPPSRNGGKPEILTSMIDELHPAKSVMVGDGISDLETQDVVDSFIGFGGFAKRERVVQDADHFIHSLSELPKLLS